MASKDWFSWLDTLRSGFPISSQSLLTIPKVLGPQWIDFTHHSHRNHGCPCALKAPSNSAAALLLSGLTTYSRNQQRSSTHLESIVTKHNAARMCHKCLCGFGPLTSQSPCSNPVSLQALLDQQDSSDVIGGSELYVPLPTWSPCIGSCPASAACAHVTVTSFHTNLCKPACSLAPSSTEPTPSPLRGNALGTCFHYWPFVFPSQSSLNSFSYIPSTS